MAAQVVAQRAGRLDRRHRRQRRIRYRPGQAEVGRFNQAALLQDQRPLNRVVQFTHVARPRVTHQARLSLRRETHRGMLHFTDVLGQQPLGQRHDIGGAFAQRAPGQREHRQPIVQIFAEAPRRHFPGQVTVGGGDHADIQGNRLAPAHALDFTFLQHPQQLGLQAQGHFRDFVEQQGAAIGLFELARLRCNGAGKRAFFVTEQGGFEHVVRDRRAVDRHERLIDPAGMLVDVTRQHFFTGARLPGNQHRRVTFSHPRRQRQQLRTGRFNRHRAFAVCRAQAAQRMACHQIKQGFGFKRLDQVIRRTLTHGIDGTLYRAVGGHQQHR